MASVMVSFIINLAWLAMRCLDLWSNNNLSCCWFFLCVCDISVEDQFYFFVVYLLTHLKQDLAKLPRLTLNALCGLG